MNLLERLGLESRHFHKPSELSGGECQRITVARALAGNPDIVFADEPTGSLDRANSDNLLAMLLELGRELSTTIIIVTHDPAIAAKTSRRVTLVDGTVTEDIRQ